MYSKDLINLKEILTKLSADKESLVSLDLLIKEAIQFGANPETGKVNIPTDEDRDERGCYNKAEYPLFNVYIKEDDDCIQLKSTCDFCKEDPHLGKIVSQNKLTQDCKVLLCFLSSLFVIAGQQEDSKKTIAYLRLVHNFLKKESNIDTKNSLSEQANKIKEEVFPKINILSQNDRIKKYFENSELLKPLNINLSNLSKIFEVCFEELKIEEIPKEEVEPEVKEEKTQKEYGDFGNETQLKENYNNKDENYTQNEERVVGNNLDNPNGPTGIINPPDTNEAIRRAVENAVGAQRIREKHIKEDERKFNVKKPYDCDFVLSQLNLTFNYKQDGFYHHRRVYSNHQKNILLWYLAEKNAIPVEFAEILTDQFFGKQQLRRPTRGGSTGDVCAEQVKSFLENTKFRKHIREMKKPEGQREMFYFLDYLDFYSGRLGINKKNIQILKQFFDVKSIKLLEAKSSRLQAISEEINSPRQYFISLFKYRKNAVSENIKQNLQIIKDNFSQISNPNFSGMGSAPPKAFKKFYSEMNKIIALFESNDCLNTCYYGNEIEGKIFTQICQDLNSVDQSKREQVMVSKVKTLLFDRVTAEEGLLDAFLRNFDSQSEEEKKILYRRLVAKSPDLGRKRGETINITNIVKLTPSERKQLSELNCFDSNGKLILSDGKRSDLIRQYRLSELTLDQGDYGEVGFYDIEYLTNLIRADITNLRNSL